MRFCWFMMVSPVPDNEATSSVSGQMLAGAAMPEDKTLSLPESTVCRMTLSLPLSLGLEQATVIFCLNHRELEATRWPSLSHGLGRVHALSSLKGSPLHVCDSNALGAACLWPASVHDPLSGFGEHASRR